MSLQFRCRFCEKVFVPRERDEHICTDCGLKFTEDATPVREGSSELAFYHALANRPHWQQAEILAKPTGAMAKEFYRENAENLKG